ncbi:unnamed protein product, partial [Prorocentrum cordatum]
AWDLDGGAPCCRLATEPAVSARPTLAGAGAEPVPAASAEGLTTVVRISVRGMSCSSCTATVRRALMGVEGVRNANVSLQDGSSEWSAAEVICRHVHGRLCHFVEHAYGVCQYRLAQLDPPMNAHGCEAGGSRAVALQTCCNAVRVMDVLLRGATGPLKHARQFTAPAIRRMARTWKGSARRQCWLAGLRKPLS